MNLLISIMNLSISNVLFNSFSIFIFDVIHQQKRYSLNNILYSFSENNVHARRNYDEKSNRRVPVQLIKHSLRYAKQLVKKENARHVRNHLLVHLVAVPPHRKSLPIWLLKRPWKNVDVPWRIIVATVANLNERRYFSRKMRNK